MNLGEFYRVNGISGADVRTDFNTLVKIGDPIKIEDYINEHSITQIVSIEDFIGSGDQFEKILAKIPDCIKKLPVLFVPLLICYNGDNTISKMLNGYSNWQIDPVIIIDEGSCLTPKANLSNKHLERRVLEVAKNFSNNIKGNTTDEMIYGFGKTGALVVLHSNTPDNTMPFIWWADNWNALFPRSSRT